MVIYNTPRHIEYTNLTSIKISPLSIETSEQDRPTLRAS